MSQKWLEEKIHRNPHLDYLQGLIFTLSCINCRRFCCIGRKRDSKTETSGWRWVLTEALLYITKEIHGHKWLKKCVIAIKPKCMTVSHKNAIH
jgi:hypothetical protein